MELRWIFRSAASKPLVSLYPRAPRLFSTSALRANSILSSLIKSTLDAGATTTGQGGRDRPPPSAHSSANIYGAEVPLGTSLPFRHRASNYGASSTAAAPIQHLDVKPKMGPTAGRSVLVTTDVSQALMRLRSILSQNKVRQDFHMQKFHERPGLKRKRLASERHRRRFKEGFKRMVSIVLDMKKKGM